LRKLRFQSNEGAGEQREEAYEYGGYFMPRWKIERFHYVLKSGCGIEKLHEWSIDKTTTLILMYSIIVGKILNMTYAGRLKPELPCSVLWGKVMEIIILHSP
jgi:hypothetical protein